MTIGVLALQGAFIEHIKILNSLGAETFEIRQKKDIERSFDGLVFPGGESTVMGKLLWDLELMEPIKELISGGMPVFGTCAGLILLAEKIYDDSTVHLGTMNITARRNAYGRQLGSFNTEEEFSGIGKIPMTFIRAPYIESCGSKAEILAVADGKIVAARQENQLATAFHPELTEDMSVHRYFLNMISEK
jgi:5'-phosphate synthase pdxT subunit